MKKNGIVLAMMICLVCLVCLTVFYGCETVKGMGRDIKNADEWVRDHTW